MQSYMLEMTQGKVSRANEGSDWKAEHTVYTEATLNMLGKKISLSAAFTLRPSPFLHPLPRLPTEHQRCSDDWRLHLHQHLELEPAM